MHRSNIVSAGCQLPDSTPKARAASFLRAMTGVVFVAGTCTGFFPHEIQAALTLSNPLRTISSSNNKGSSYFDQAAGFDNMNASVRADWQEYWGPPANTLGVYYTTAQQTSTVSGSEIRASGWVTGTGSFEFWGEEMLEQQAASYFKINFTIDEPCMVSLTGKLTLSADTGGTNYDLPEVWVILTGQHGPLFSAQLDYASGRMTRIINETFEPLEAGDYNLTAYANTHGSYHPNGIGGFGHAAYDITLIPEPAPLGFATLSVLIVLFRRTRTGKSPGSQLRLGRRL
jgi:hypothetical protein